MCVNNDVRLIRGAGRCMMYVAKRWHPELSLQKLLSIGGMIMCSRQPIELTSIFVNSRCLESGDHDDYIKKLKKCTEVLRKTRKSPSGDEMPLLRTAGLCYLEFSSGRSESKYDNSAEVLNRTTRSVPMEFPDEKGDWPEAEFMRVFREELQQVCNEIEGDFNVDPEDEFRRRCTWGADGSSSTTWPGEVHSAGKKSIKNIKLHRRAMLETKSLEQFMNETDDLSSGAREAELHATASDKYENAKGRLLLAGDDDSYIRQQILFSAFEKALQGDKSFGHPNQMGAAANQLIEYQRLMNQLRSGGQDFYAGSHDWSDFNIHLTPLMQAVLCEEICRRVEKDIQHGPSLEKYRKIRNAEARALLNQFMHFADEVHKVVQGECSGIRATDLFNSIDKQGFLQDDSAIVEGSGAFS